MAFYRDFIRMRRERKKPLRQYISKYRIAHPFFGCGRTHKNVCGAATPQGVRHTPHTNTTLYSILQAKVGGDLLSHTLPGAVPSAQAGLASGFGKGPGVTPPH